MEALSGGVCAWGGRAVSPFTAVAARNGVRTLPLSPAFVRGRHRCGLLATRCLSPHLRARQTVSAPSRG